MASHSMFSCLGFEVRGSMPEVGGLDLLATPKP